MSDRDSIQFDPQKSDAIEHAIVRHIRDDEARSRGRRRLRLAVAFGVAGVLVAGALTAGVILLNAAPVTDTSVVHCFSRAEIGPGDSYPGSSVVVANQGRQVSITDAIDACSVLWRQGVFEDGFDPTATTPPEQHQIPANLTVCVMRDGTAAVIPGLAAVCASLGLAPRL